MTTNLRDFLSSSPGGGALNVSLEGVFVLSGEQAYLACTFEEKDDLKHSVALDYEHLKTLLLSKVPAYGGGPYLYCDQAIVEGVLTSSLGGDGLRFSFREVSSFALTRRNHRFQVLP